MLTRRLKRLTIALLLPLLALRGMLPAGYMPVAEQGELRIVMCSAGLAAWETQPEDGAGRQLPPNAGQCAFAQSAAAPPVIALQPVAAPSLITFAATPRAIFVAPWVPAHTPPARGPPALS